MFGHADLRGFSSYNQNLISESLSTIEDTLRAAMDRGTELHFPEPRDLAPLQVRGLVDESKLQGTAELQGTVHVETVSEDDNDGAAATAECTDDESLGEISSMRQLSSVHLSCFPSEQQNTVALDVGRCAGSLMQQLGVTDPDEVQPVETDETGTVVGVEAMARFLEAGSTFRERPGLLMLRS